MGIYTGGRSRAINSPRHLTLRHARRTAYHYKKAINALLLGEEDEGPDLLPGQEKLNSYWAPSLLAGPEYTITAEQTVKEPNSDEPLLLTSKQPFIVDAPRFSLPEGSVYSIYPPSGYPVENRILPHVVLNDPHLPWERVGSPSSIDIEDPRNRVPWLVLFSFTQDELRLDPGSLKGYDPKQTGTLSVKMTVGEIRAIQNVATPFTSSVTDDTVGEFVFIKPGLFKSLFSTFDEENRRVDKKNPDVDQYKYLSHVRKINTTGMAIAGTEDVGIFSIVVGNRAGPLHNKVPVTVAVHLLSIEGVEKMEFPGLDKDYISLCSLHSWNYTVLPPDTLNVYDTFVELGKTLSVLRPPQALIDTMKDETSRVRERLARRLEDGYSLVKYRTQTGEPTMAFYRSPFTPTVVLPIPQFDTCSNSGQDFQILDQELGIMDVTYSSAWHVGRVLAAGDQSFTAALTRFRGAIHRMSFQDSKLAAVKASGNDASFRTRKDVLLDLKKMVNMLGRIHQPHLKNRDVENSDGGYTEPSPQPEDRWYRPRLSKEEFLPLGLYNPAVQDTYLDSAIKAARELAKAKDGTMYDETNSPVSTDWMAILAWVMDRKFLSGVPAHYLISDPSHLESESLNFFYIDPNWVDALIDGALSLGNEQGTDIIRQAIKIIINDYVDAKPISLSHRPQIPTYGFYLRSDIVTMYPDLKVDTLPTYEGERPTRAPLLRHEIVADGIMLGLFDRVPGSDEFTGLTFTQPSHQQVFAAANSLTADKAIINIRKQYTVPMDIRKGDNTRHDTLKPTIECTPGKADSLFLWNTVPDPGREAIGTASEDDEMDPPTENDLRAIKTPAFAKRQLDMLNDPEKGVGTYTDPEGHSKKYFDDDTPNSALFAMQLTDPIWFLEIPFQKKGEGPIPALASLQPPSGKQEVRKLHSLKHSVVPPLYPPPPNGPEDGPVSPKRFFIRPTPGVASGGGPGAGALSHAAPLTHAPADAPHIRSIIMTESLEPLATHSQVLSYRTTYQDTIEAAGPAAPPKFDCSVYSPQLEVVLLDKDELRQDLIFSVLVTCPRDNQYALKEFQIVVPLGTPTTVAQNTLMESYDGPGPRMLSNLRFNVLTSIATIEHRKLLSLRLVPRSSTGHITMKGDFELGFLLCLAKLNVQKYPVAEVELTTNAHYVYPHQETMTEKFKVIVRKDESGV
ncbi:hypothetical protein F4803DRAFT_364629 [Xylaria telfairii]|nr:hypothetical protein F4803DRAFT_364629 [Xylaria telfairii]